MIIPLVRGHISDDFNTTVLPHMSGIAMALMVNPVGAFHGVIAKLSSGKVSRCFRLDINLAHITPSARLCAKTCPPWITDGNVSPFSNCIAPA